MVESVRPSAGQTQARARKSPPAQRSRPLSPRAFARTPRTPSPLTISPPLAASADGGSSRLRVRKHPLTGSPCRPNGRQGSGFSTPRGGRRSGPLGSAVVTGTSPLCRRQPVCNRVFRKAQTHRARENVTMTDDTTRVTRRNPHFARTSANPHKKSTTERLARDLNVQGRAGRCLSRSRGVRSQQLVPTRRHPLAHLRGRTHGHVEECARADRCQRAAPPSAATVPEHPTRAANT